MNNANRSKLTVQGAAITVIAGTEGDFISLTDMVQGFQGGSSLIEQWLRSKDTLLFLGAWEKMHNLVFNSLEFEGIKNEAGRNSFFLSIKRWIGVTNAKGIIATPGRYGGTYAHQDIAFEFGTWLSPEFKLYLIKEFQRLKEDENRRKSLDWNLNRTLAKLNYRIHTDAIKEHLIPALVSKEQVGYVYASEADILNVALFGLTSKQWRDANPTLDGNMRDYATLQQLLVMVNLESMNAELIRIGLTSGERLTRLNQIAIQQLRSLHSINTRGLHPRDEPPHGLT